MTPDIEAWDAWHPRTLAARLAGVTFPWYVAGGWAVDLFLGEHPGSGRDVADQGHMACGATLGGGPAGGIGGHLDGSRLGGVSSEVAEALERVQVAVHRRRRRQADGLADLPDGRRVAAFTHGSFDEDQDFLLALGELRLGHDRVPSARGSV